ncbi:MAG: chorismate-binding protein, partial [Actinomycetota bacterium]|nr:chorismate-binding protein [Actinomycetota bacterium]
MFAELFAGVSQRLEVALRRARASGSPVLVSVTERLPGVADPVAIVAASRRPGESWFCFEQPDRDGAGLAGLGCVMALEAGGEGRFSRVAGQWSALCAATRSDAVDGPPGSGLVAVGGFAFSPEGGGSASWDGFAPASLIVPEVSLARRAGSTWLTLNLEASPDDTRADLLGRVQRRLAELRDAPLPLLDPAPTGVYKVQSAMPPSHYEEAVAQALRRIRADELEKVVLAREVQVRAPVAHDPAAVLGLLREAFPSCYVFAVGRGDATFLAASPELLVRREGQRASSVALAGSIRRSADPAVDDHLGEQLLRSEKDREENAIVARRIARMLRPHAVWVTAATDPALVRVANIQHLATPIRAQ